MHTDSLATPPIRYHTSCAGRISQGHLNGIYGCSVLLEHANHLGQTKLFGHSRHNTHLEVNIQH